MVGDVGADGFHGGVVEEKDAPEFGGPEGGTIVVGGKGFEERGRAAFQPPHVAIEVFFDWGEEQMEVGVFDSGGVAARFHIALALARRSVGGDDVAILFGSKCVIGEVIGEVSARRLRSSAERIFGDSVRRWEVNDWVV